MVTTLTTDHIVPLPSPATTWPAGNLDGSWLVSADRVQLAGVGQYETKRSLETATPQPQAVFSGSYAPYVSARRAHFRDMTIDAKGTGANCTGVVIYTMLDEVLFERCRFVNYDFGVTISEATRVTFVDCEFAQPGTQRGIGVLIQGPCAEVSFTRCRFLWNRQGIVADSATYVAPIPPETATPPPLRREITRITINHCTFICDYWAGAVLIGGSSNAVYTSTQLHVTSGIPFLGLTYQSLAKGARPIRVLPLLTSGTVPSPQPLGMRLTDTSKNFTTLGVAFGDFVRVGSATAPSKWAMVRSVDGSNLDVDRGWFDSNYEPTLPPAPGDTYYVLQTVLGRITSQNVADSKLTVERWYRLNGSTAPTPAADTRFELLMNNDNAPPTGSVQAETYSRVHLVGCYTRGNLSDQFALGGDDCSVIDCEAEYGRDMGLTINGSRTTVVGGRYTRNGAGGIYVGNPGAELPGGGDVRIVGVSSRGNGVEAFGTSFPGGNNCDLFLDGARARVIGCHFDKASGPEIHAVVTTSNAPNALLTGCTAVGGYATPSVLNGGPSTTITDSVGLTV